MKKVIIYFLDVENEEKYFTDLSNAEQYAITEELDEDLIQQKTLTEDEAILLWETSVFLDSNPHTDVAPLFDFLLDNGENDEEEEEEAPEAPKTAPVKSLDKMKKDELLQQYQILAAQVTAMQKQMNEQPKPQKLSFEQLKKEYEEKSRLLSLRDFLKETLTNIKSVLFRPKADNPFEIDGYSLLYVRNNEQILKVQNALVLERFRSFILNELENSISEVNSKI